MAGCEHTWKMRGGAGIFGVMMCTTCGENLIAQPAAPADRKAEPEYETDEICQEIARNIIEGRLDEISPQERKKVFALYCTHCGDKQPEGDICRCWDDS